MQSAAKNQEDKAACEILFETCSLSLGVREAKDFGLNSGSLPGANEIPDYISCCDNETIDEPLICGCTPEAEIEKRLSRTTAYVCDKYFDDNESFEGEIHGYSPYDEYDKEFGSSESRQECETVRECYKQNTHCGDSYNDTYSPRENEMCNFDPYKEEHNQFNALEYGVIGSCIIDSDESVIFSKDNNPSLVTNGLWKTPHLENESPTFFNSQSKNLTSFVPSAIPIFKDQHDDDNSFVSDINLDDVESVAEQDSVNSDTISISPHMEDEPSHLSADIVDDRYLKESTLLPKTTEVNYNISRRNPIGKRADDQTVDKCETVSEKMDRDIQRVSGQSYPFESNFKQQYTLGPNLGRGGFGFVFKAIQNDTGKEVAVKFIALAILTEIDWTVSSDEQDILKEVYMLQLCRNPGIIKCVDFFLDTEYALMVTELHGFDSGSQCHDLGHFVDVKWKKGILDESIAAFVFAQIASSVSYMHSLDIVHRDLKPGNVLIDDNLTVKIIDL